jgi:hypothetical protein
VRQRAYSLLIFDVARETFESSFWMSDGQDNQFYPTDRQFVPASRVGGGYMREGYVLLLSRQWLWTILLETTA